MNRSYSYTNDLKKIKIYKLLSQLHREIYICIGPESYFLSAILYCKY